MTTVPLLRMHAEGSNMRGRYYNVLKVHSELSLQTDYSDSGFKLLHTATEAQ